MVKPVPAGVEADLLAFFRARCPNPALIKDRTSNVKHLCGYDTKPLGWRGLTGPINGLRHIAANRIRLDPTDMDGCLTIANIEDNLRRMAIAAGSADVAAPRKKKSKAKKTVVRRKKRRAAKK